jgi:amidase
MPAETVHLGDAWFALCAREAYEAHAARFGSQAELFGPFFSDFLAIGASITAEQVAGANQLRGAFSRNFDALLETVDVMVCPSGGVTFPVEQATLYGNREAIEPLFAAVQMRFTIPADFAGTPTLTVPCGFAADGRPYALQFMGRHLSEPTLCRFGHAYEGATDWHDRHPPV